MNRFLWHSCLGSWTPTNYLPESLPSLPPTCCCSLQVQVRVVPRSFVHCLPSLVISVLSSLFLSFARFQVELGLSQSQDDGGGGGRGRGQNGRARDLPLPLSPSLSSRLSTILDGAISPAMARLPSFLPSRSRAGGPPSDCGRAGSGGPRGEGGRPAYALRVTIS